MKTEVSFWLISFCWMSIIFFYIIDVMRYLNEFGLASAMGGGMVGLLIGIFGIKFCAKQNVKWATEINKSKNLAYFIGSFLNLLGVLIYWIYYIYKK